MNKKILLSLLLVGMLASCGGKDPSTSEPVSETPSASVATSISTPASESTDLPETITDINVANSVPGTYTVKGVVVGTTTASYIVKDATGVIMVYLEGQHSFEVGNYLKITGTTVQRYANCQFTIAAVATLLTETAPDVSAVPTPLTKEYWNNYDGTIGDLISGRVMLHEEASRMYFKYEDCAMLGQFSYADPALGFAAENSGKFADIVGFMLDTSTSNPNKHNLLLVSLELVEVSSSGLSILTPTTTTLEIGKTLILKSVVEPEGSDQSVTWVSSDEATATVDAIGVVRGVAVGTTTITVTSIADPTKTDEVVIIVETPRVRTYAAVAEYDFSSKTQTASTEITNDTLFTTFEESLTAGELLVQEVAATKIYFANTSQGPTVGGLKFGTASIEGSMTLIYPEGTKILRVEVLAYNWTASSSTNTIAVNYSDAQTPEVTGSTLVFDVTETNEIRFDIKFRAVIQEITLYTEAQQ